jgi:alpha-glucosidase
VDPPHPAVQPWLPIVPEHRVLAVDRQERDPVSQLAYARRVLALRKRYDVLMSGSVQILEASDAILAFERKWREQRLLCVFNLSTDPRDWKPSGDGRWRIIERSGSVEDWKLPGLSGLIAERV